MTATGGDFEKAFSGGDESYKRIWEFTNSRLDTRLI